MIAANTILEDRLSEPVAPVLKPHHGYKSWTSTWWDASRHRRTKRFGREGEIAPRQAKARFDHWFQTQYLKKDYVRNPTLSGASYTVEQMASDYLEYAKTVYVKNGENTSHVWTVLYAMQSLIDHHGRKLAGDFKASDLAALRDAMIYGTDKKTKASRKRSMKTVNGRLQCIKQAFRWAAIERGIIPQETAVAVEMVSALAKGRSEANDPVPVVSVSKDVVWKVMDVCPPCVAAMIELIWWTGMRPGEACLMRPCDISMSGREWTYRPHSHKMQHMERNRVIPIGPQARRLLEPWMNGDANQYMFDPREAVEWHRQHKNAERITPMNAGNCRGMVKTLNPKWQPGEVYTVSSFRQAIRRACKRADVPTWKPNQLRHSYGTRVRAQYGVEAASVMLGHSNVSTTEIYAEKTLRASVKLSRRVG